MKVDITFDVFVLQQQDVGVYEHGCGCVLFFFFFWLTLVDPLIQRLYVVPPWDFNLIP